MVRSPLVTAGYTHHEESSFGLFRTKPRFDSRTKLPSLVRGCACQLLGETVSARTWAERARVNRDESNATVGFMFPFTFRPPPVSTTSIRSMGSGNLASFDATARHDAVEVLVPENRTHQGAKRKPMIAPQRRPAVDLDGGERRSVNVSGLEFPNAQALASRGVIHSSCNESHTNMPRETGDTQRGHAELVTFYEKHRLGIFRYCLSLLQDVELAKDVVQEAFLRVASAGPAFHAVEAPEAWLFEVARNCCMDVFRRGKTQRNLRVNLNEQVAVAPPRAHAEALHVVRDHVRRLWAHPDVDEVDRRLLTLLGENFPTAEIATALGMSPQAVNQRKRGLRRLVLELENGDDASYMH
jgi:RNA polymerase sigma factor (sigma-70 family)